MEGCHAELMHLCRVYRNEPLDFIREYETNEPFQLYVRQRGAMPMSSGGTYFLVHYPSNKILVTGPPVPGVETQLEGFQQLEASKAVKPGIRYPPLTSSQRILGRTAPHVPANSNEPLTGCVGSSDSSNSRSEPHVVSGRMNHVGGLSAAQSSFIKDKGRNASTDTGTAVFSRGPAFREMGAPSNHFQEVYGLALPQGNVGKAEEQQSHESGNLSRQQQSPHSQGLARSSNTQRFGRPFQVQPNPGHQSSIQNRKTLIQYSSQGTPESPPSLTPAVQRLFDAQVLLEGQSIRRSQDPVASVCSEELPRANRDEPDSQHRLPHSFRAPEAEKLVSGLEGVHLESVTPPKSRKEDGPAKSEAYRPPSRKAMRVSSRRLRYPKDWNRLTECRKDVCGDLTKSGHALYRALNPSLHECQRRNRLTAHLRKVIRSEWGSANLFMYGSSGTGMFLRGGDVDLCLEIPIVEKAKDGENGLRRAEQLIFKRLTSILRRAKMQNVKCLRLARVPIVKFHDVISGLDVDICLNNEFVAHNTALVKHYLGLDPRARWLAMIVKYWARCRMINSTHTGTLSSYGYMMLVINYLQCSSPPCLPCLQKRRDGKGRLTERLESPVWFNRSLTRSTYRSRNRRSLGDLVLGFFRFYARQFDYREEVACVRRGCRLRKDEKNWGRVRQSPTRQVKKEREKAQGTTSWKDTSGKCEKFEDAPVDPEVGHKFSIEDPFVLDHDLGQGIDEETLGVIRDEFELAYCSLAMTGRVESICEEWNDRKVPLVVTGSPHIDGEQDRGIIVRKKTTKTELAENELIGTILNMVWEDLDLGQVKFDKEKKDFPIPWVKRLDGAELDRNVTIRNAGLKDNEQLFVGFMRSLANAAGK